MAGKVVEMTQTIVEPIAKRMNLEIVDIEYVKKNTGYNLTIFIDKIGGVSIDDCEELHRAIDEPLDELDPTNNVPYILNVSSAGIDRPLKNMKDYTRNIGKEIEVKLYAPLNNRKLFVGLLKEVNEKSFIIEADNENIIIEYDKVAITSPVIKF